MLKYLMHLQKIWILKMLKSKPMTFLSLTFQSIHHFLQTDVNAFLFDLINDQFDVDKSRIFVKYVMLKVRKILFLNVYPCL